MCRIHRAFDRTCLLLNYREFYSSFDRTLPNSFLIKYFLLGFCIRVYLFIVEFFSLIEGEMSLYAKELSSIVFSEDFVILFPLTSVGVGLKYICKNEQFKVTC